MKILSDFIAILLFFGTYTVTKDIILATVVAVAAGLLQAAYTFVRFKKLNAMQWLSLVLIVVFGGLTIVLKDRTFFMLKTTILTWMMAAVMWVLQLRGQNGLQLLLGKEIDLPKPVWNKVAYAWIAFFVLLGLLNLGIAYPFTEEREAVWVNFKMYAYLPIVLVFSLAQGVYMVRHLPKEK